MSDIQTIEIDAPHAAPLVAAQEAGTDRHYHNILDKFFDALQKLCACTQKDIAAKLKRHHTFLSRIRHQSDPVYVTVRQLLHDVEKHYGDVQGFRSLQEEFEPELTAFLSSLKGEKLHKIELINTAR